MSLQVSRVKGIGYKLDYNDFIFSHISDKCKESEFIDIINMGYSYYDHKEEANQIGKDKLKIVTDGMNGEYIYIMYIEECSYIENTSGDEYWCNKFRYDDWVKKYARENISILTGRDLGEPSEYDFLHYQ